MKILVDSELLKGMFDYITLFDALGVTEISKHDHQIRVFTN